MGKTTVANQKHLAAGWRKDPHYAYIGRHAGKISEHPQSAGYFGNPFKLTTGEPRGATIERFRAYAEQRIREDELYRLMVLGLAGKCLVCFCKPAPCHGDVLAEIADRLAATTEEPNHG